MADVKRKKKDRRLSSKKRVLKDKDFKLTLYWTKTNTLFMVIGAVLIVIGFIFLYIGDTVISPIALVLGYVVFIPLGLLWKKNKGGK